MDTKAKQKEPKPFVGDTVEISNCKSIGLSRNKIQGILIGRPINSKSVQIYAVWIPKGILSKDKAVQEILLENMRKQDTSWDFRNATTGYDTDHILFFPTTFKNNIKHIAREGDELVPGDIVLDRRWFCRYCEKPIRIVLAIKYDEGYDMNRVCIENPYAKSYLAFGTWVYPVLRRDLIRLSRRKIKEFEEENTYSRNRLAEMLEANRAKAV